ncbi:hypothetical protein [Rhizobium sophorae]|uniref:hypothetical protein n=1 Tax=Rhizobium sophorae TaxID=1535242 RepID=UPI001FE4CEB2|nr:hypothetical protein [Rhizobium sophorae]
MACSKIIPVDQIDCSLVGIFELQERVEEARKSTWAAVCAKCPAAFDGALLRMASFRVEGGGLSIAANRTRFSAYVATRHPAFASEHPHADRADPLGLTAIVLTADGNVIVTKRSLLGCRTNPRLRLSCRAQMRHRIELKRLNCLFTPRRIFSMTMALTKTPL